MSDEALIYAGGFQKKNAVSVHSVEKRCLWGKKSYLASSHLLKQN